MLLELRASLKPGGVLFSSNPPGHNVEGWNGGCYGAAAPLRQIELSLFSSVDMRSHPGLILVAIPPLKPSLMAMLNLLLGISMCRQARLRSSISPVEQHPALA